MKETTMDIRIRSSNINPLDLVLDKLCMTPIGLLGLVVLLILPFIPPFNQEYILRWLIYCGLLSCLAIGFDLSAGFINIVNFGYAAVAGYGGYTAALLAVNFGLSPWIGMFIGGLNSAIIGFIIGIISLRLRGIFAACLSWFFGLSLMGIATKWVGLTRGPLGLRVPRLFEGDSNVPFYFLIILMLLITYLICKWTVRSKFGIAFRAIGQNMDAARASGINPVFNRVFNFTLSCFFAGVFGGFYAHFYGILTPEVMHTNKVVEILAVAYIGGRGSLWGGAVVAFPFILLMEIIRSTLSEYPGLNLVIYAIVLIMVMIYYPGGFAHLYNTRIRKIKNKTLQYLFNGAKI